LWVSIQFFTSVGTKPNKLDSRRNCGDSAVGDVRPSADEAIAKFLRERAPTQEACGLANGQVESIGALHASNAELPITLG